MKKLINEIPICDHFLPLEPYDPLIGHEVPEELLEKYATNGKVDGFAEYIFPNGDKEERLCQIISYNRAEAKYIVKWENTDTIRKVSRLCLRFKKEDAELLKARVEIATESRRLGELIVRMLEEIKSVDTTGVAYPPHYLQRIKQMINGYHINEFPNLRSVKDYNNLSAAEKYELKPYYYQEPKIMEGKQKYSEKEMADILKEIMNDYILSVQKSHIEYCLPFSQKFIEYKDILKEEKYIPLCDKCRMVTARTGLIKFQRKLQFSKLLDKISNRLHQARLETLEPLMNLNVKTVKYMSKHFIILLSQNILTPEQFEEKNRKQFVETNKDINDAMRDLQIVISNMVLDVWNKRRELMEGKKNTQSKYETLQLPEAFQQRYTSFQSLLNMIFERSIRDVFERSFNVYNSWLERAMNVVTEKIGESNEKVLPDTYLLELHNNPFIKSKLSSSIKLIIELKINEESFDAEYIPSIDGLHKTIYGIPEYIASELRKIPCFSCKELGFARENGKALIINEDDGYTKNSFERLGYLLGFHIKLLESYSTLLIPTLQIFKMDISDDPKCSHNDEVSINKGREELQLVLQIEQRFRALMPHAIMNFGIIHVDCSKFRSQMIEQIEVVRNIIFKRITEEMIGSFNEVKEKVDEVNLICYGKPTNIEELDKIQKFLKNLNSVIIEIKQINKMINLKHEIAIDNCFEIPAEPFKLIFQAFLLPLSIAAAKQCALKTIESNKDKFKEELRRFTAQIIDETKEITNDLENLEREDNINDYEKNYNSFNSLSERLEKAISNSATINMRESILSFINTNFDDLKKLKKEFEPFFLLWTLAKDYYFYYPIWRSGYLSEISKEKVTNAVESALADLKRIIKYNLNGKPGPLQVASQLQELYSGFAPYLPLIINIKNQYLQQRHWDEIAELTKIPELNSTLQVSLDTLLTKHITDYTEKIAEISDYALKEQNIEVSLKKMKEEWMKKSFQYQPDEESNSLLLVQHEPLISLGESQLITIQTTKLSPFSKNIFK